MNLTDPCTDPKAVNLYHACAKVIKPATEKQQLSLVEAMSAGDQIPDFFTSHWFVHRVPRVVCCSSLHVPRWGKPPDQMLVCLRTMSTARGLQQKMMLDWKGNPTDEPNPDYVGERSLYFWICGRTPLKPGYGLPPCVVPAAYAINRENPTCLAFSLYLSVSLPHITPICPTTCCHPRPAPLSPIYACCADCLPLTTHTTAPAPARLLVSFSAFVCLSQSASPLRVY